MDEGTSSSSYSADLQSEEQGSSVLLASVAGQVERINKLVSVKPAKARYVGDVGDLVVGRISTIESKKWKVDIKGWKVI